MECTRRCTIYACIMSAVLILGSQSQGLIGPDPEEAAVLVGSTITLQCSRTPGGAAGTIAWNEEIPEGTDQIIFFGTARGSGDAKYLNFDIDSDGTDRFDLVIDTIAVEDEGRYFCKQVTTNEVKYGIRTVEVQSTELKMTQDGSDTSNVVVTEDETSEIVCTAKGARPAVEIRWYHKTNGGSESRITAGVGNTEVDNGDGTFDTVGTLNYTASKDYNDGQLRCQTYGQQVAESREHISTLDVKFLPDVTLIYGNNQATCTVESANPPVEMPGGFIFIANDTETYPPTSCEGNACYLDLKVDFDTNLRCNVTNDVGTATATYLAEPGATPPPEPTTKPTDTTKKGVVSKSPNSGGGPNVGAIAAGVVVAIIVIAVVIALLVYFLVIKKGNKTKNSQGSELKPVNGSGGDSSKPKDRPTPAPRNSKGDAHDNEEGKKKVKPNDNPDGLLYAQLDHSNKPARNSGNGNNIIRTEEPTEYADVKTFIV